MKALIDPRGMVNEVVANNRTFEVHPDFQWVDVPANVNPAPGWDYVSGEFVPPPAPPETPISKIEALEAALTKKGVISKAEIDAEKVKK